ncbi:MAG: hypothetical protein QXP36_05805 [Conexivisphaerales archaeon]
MKYDGYWWRKIKTAPYYILARFYEAKMEASLKNREKILKQSTSNLKKLIKKSLMKSEIYRKNFLNLKGKNLEHYFLNLPILSKEMLQISEFSTIATKSVKVMTRYSTSGSTGKPLSVYRTNRERMYNAITWERGYKLNGYNPTRKKKKLFRYLRKIDLNNANREDIKEIPLSQNIDNVVSELVTFSPNIIETYPSDLFILSKFIVSNHIKISSVEKIFTHSEMLPNYIRSIAIQAFGAEVIDLYGAAETGCIAYQCPLTPSHYHVNQDLVKLEVLDSQGVVRNYGRGELIVTNLYCYGYPLARYRLGDIVELVENLNSCDISYDIIKIIEGKTYDFIVSRSGTVISPHILKELIGSSNIFKDFRLVSYDDFKLVIEFSRNDSLTTNEISYGLSVLRKSICKEINWQQDDIIFKEVTQIEHDVSNKFKSIVRINNHWVE